MARDAYAKDDEDRIGFQRSETSGVEVEIFSNRTDPILVSDEKSDLSGRNNRDGKPTVTGVTTSKAMGGGSGTFTIEVKCASKAAEKIIEGFQDDDWVDVTFTRHSRKWHVMRGLIDSITENEAIVGNGATTRSYTISGRDFTRIWEITPLWFDIFAAKPQGLSRQAELSVFGGVNLTGLTPVNLINGFMFDLFRQQINAGRGTWAMSNGMRGRNNQDLFIDSITTLFSGYMTGWNDDFKRVSVGLGSIQSLVGNNFWDFIKEYSDPSFCELFTDVYPNGDFPRPGDEARPENSEMVVVFRDRPFVTVDSGIPEPWRKGNDADWYNLPVFIVPRAQIGTGSLLVRSGAERYNCFQSASALVQESQNQSTNVGIKPLWDLDDVLLHGLRRYDVTTRYVAFNTNDYIQNRMNRAIARDWYCLNAYFKSGTLPLAIGRPDIRIGSRIRIPGVKSPEQDFDAYVEQVTHSWAFPRGLKTTLGVTRGWTGGDDDYQNKLRSTISRYTTSGEYQ